MIKLLDSSVAWLATEFSKYLDAEELSLLA